MKLEGIHHVTAITADARANLDFYARLLGLRLIKKTVNFDDPTACHLYYGDETGSPGSILTFFEYPGAAQGQAGAGMVHRIVWRAGSPAALETRLSELGVADDVLPAIAAAVAARLGSAGGEPPARHDVEALLEAAF